ncbi:8-oxoguanine glycosylase ogg1, partial [Rhizophlyctis rosea]
MTHSIPTQWHSLNVSPKELRLDTTLKCGQSFTWVQTHSNEWTSTLGNPKRLITLKQLDDDVHFRSYDIPANTDFEADVRKTLRDYFQLDVSLADLYKRWCQDENFKRKAANLTGIRMLCQDPTETLLTFICTSNNNIPRITSMISSLCTHYGRPLGTLPTHTFHTFPTISSLVSAQHLEFHLRQLGFGYRAKYIHATCQAIAKSAKEEG